MGIGLGSRSLALALSLACALLALAVFAASGSGAASVRGCASFTSQQEAEEYFLARGGGPGHRVGGLDPDRDGVACEGLPGPYVGYATIGYNLKRRFLYGAVSMPTEASGEGFACMTGNRHFLAGPRLLHVYRVTPRGDVALLDEYGIGAEARASSGRLLWKADRALGRPGRYFVEFEERVAEKPYGANPCPGFRSRAVLLGPGTR